MTSSIFCYVCYVERCRGRRPPRGVCPIWLVLAGLLPYRNRTARCKLYSFDAQLSLSVNNPVEISSDTGREAETYRWINKCIAHDPRISLINQSQSRGYVVRPQWADRRASRGPKATLCLN
ncbi:hypothetical protein RB195_008118 [Necator americanus]|uniref:OmpR/PhoB-type domain-containing protein n=1 Tax=Necator americanus TaxID=51031 RepID=A0ABR1CMW6_NECAM